MTYPPKYVTELEVSRLIGRALSSLRNDRFNGRGLPFIKLGRSVKYDIDEVEAYMQARKITPQEPL